MENFDFDKNNDNKKLEMEIYNHLHIIDSHSNYGYNKNDKYNKCADEKKELAEYIYNNYDQMGENELKQIVIKCMSQKKIRMEL